MFLLYSLLIMGAIYGYVQWRLISLLTIPLSVKVIFAVLLLPSIFNLWAVLFFGDVLPAWVSKTLAGLQVLLVYLFTITFLLDIIRLFHQIPDYIPKIAVILCMCLSVYSVWNALQLPTTKKIELTSEILKEKKPLKIVHLSDFHIGQGFDGKWLKQTIKKVNTLQADLILITGDLVDKSPTDLGDEIKELKNLKSKLGTYIVFGNHEYYHQSRQWKQFFNKIGIPVLFNENVTLIHDSEPFTLAGIDFGATYLEEKADFLLEKTFKNSNPKHLRLLMAHHPAVFKKTEKYNVFLQLSGHTHGGMISPVDLIVKLSNKGFLRGLYKKANSYLYVSNGTGLWGGFPARLGTVNEITQMMLNDTFIFALMLTFFTGLSTGLGSLVAFILKKDDTKLLSFMLGFSAGVMLYVSFLALLPESIKLLTAMHSYFDSLFILCGNFLLGITLAILIDKIVPEPKINETNIETASGLDNKKLLKTGLFVAIILALHNFPEGLSTFISALSQSSVAYAVALAMALHNIPEGIAISIPIFYATGNRKKAFLYSFLSGLAEPVGAIIGYFILLPFINNGLIGAIFAFIAGIMSYISIVTLMPLAREVKDKNLSIKGVLFGFCLMTGIFIFLA